MTQKHYPYDAGLEHRAAGSAAVTASANYATVDQQVATRTDFYGKIESSGPPGVELVVRLLEQMGADLSGS